MANYEDWNKAIFTHFFNDTGSKNVFFCVDEETIENIGKSLGIEKENAIDNFCKVVLNECVRETSSGISVNLGRVKTYPKGGIPYQTSTIAFAIFAASLMGKDAEYSPKAYWGRLKEIAEKYLGAVSLKSTWGPDDNRFINLFSDFAKFVTDNYFPFEFPTMFNYENLRRDFVGLPIFQSMISTKDKWILTKRFQKYIDSNALPYDKIVRDSREKEEKFSSVFKKIRDNNDKNISNILKHRIIVFFQNWDGNEYDKYNHLTKLRLRLGYREAGNNEFRFFYTSKIVPDVNTIETKEFTLKKNNGEEYYSDGFILQNQVSLDIKIANIQEKTSDNIKSKRKLILLKHICGHDFVETNRILTGERFSVIGNFSALENFIDEKRDYYFELDENSCTAEIDSDNDIWLIHNIIAINYDNEFIFLDRKEKYEFVKGLKGDRGLYSYIQGAEPIFAFDNVGYVIIDGKKVKSNCVDLRKNFNAIGEHIIRFENSTEHKKYSIEEFSQKSFENSDFQFIYHEISKYGMNKTLGYSSNSIVSGAAFENCEKLITNKGNSQENLHKIRYILEILKRHDNKKKYPLRKSVREKFLKMQNSDNIVLKELGEYLNQNNYIDNYMNVYINKIGKILE